MSNVSNVERLTPLDLIMPKGLYRGDFDMPNTRINYNTPKHPPTRPGKAGNSDSMDIRPSISNYRRKQQGISRNALERKHHTHYDRQRHHRQAIVIWIYLATVCLHFPSNPRSNHRHVEHNPIEKGAHLFSTSIFQFVDGQGSLKMAR